MTDIAILIKAGPYLAILILLGIVTGQSSQIHKWHKQADGLAQTIEQLARDTKVQQAHTNQTIKIVTRTIHDADERAKVVEQAPPAPNCKTKPEVMNADV